MPANTPNIIGTTVLSNLSLLGTFSTITENVTGASVMSNAVIGASGSTIAKIGLTTASIVTMTLLANRSQTTTFAFSGVTVGDLVWLNPPSSGYSNGVTAQPYCNAADVVTINFSNVSGATAVQAGPVTWVAGYIRAG